MKYSFVLWLSLLFVACNNKEYLAIGNPVKEIAVKDKAALSTIYDSMKEGDTIPITFKGKIDEVCQKKGCWMKLGLEEEKEVFVRFKDYAFFVPLNAAEREVVVQGEAYVSVTSVATLQHYAEDAGKSEIEIAAITEPKYTYSFMADGLLLEE